MIAYPSVFIFEFQTTPHWELISMFQSLSEGVYLVECVGVFVMGVCRLRGSGVYAYINV